MTGRTILFRQPCHEDWDRMTPQGRTRHCEACARPVHELREYTAEEAEALLSGPGELPCLRADIQADGRVQTRPSPGGRTLRAMVLAPALALGLNGAALAAGGGGIVGRVAASSPEQVTVTVTGPKVRRQVLLDAWGEFFVGELPPGVYELRFSAPGRKGWTARQLRVEADLVTISHSREPGFKAPEPVAIPTLGMVAPPPPETPRPVPQPAGAASSAAPDSPGAPPR